MFQKTYSLVLKRGAARAPPHKVQQAPALYLKMEGQAAKVRVGVGCFVIENTESSSRFLVGLRKGSHGRGKLALPGTAEPTTEQWRYLIFSFLPLT